MNETGFDSFSFLAERSRITKQRECHLNGQRRTLLNDLLLSSVVKDES